MAGLLQKHDFKTEAQLISAGSSKSAGLLDDTYLYVSHSQVAETLDDALELNKLTVLKELASAPTTPSANYRRIYAKTTGKLYEMGSDGIEKALGGGGGGGSGLDWNSDSGAPLEVVDGVKSYTFASLADLDGAQVNKVFLKIPESYSAGVQVKLYIYIYSASTSGTNFIKTTTYLIRPGTEAVTSTANSYTSTNSAVSVSGTSKVPQKITLDLSNSSGVINSISLAAGHLLRIEMERGTDTDTAVVQVLYSMEPTFN